MNNSDKDFQLNLIKIKLILKSENQENKDFVDTYSQFCNLNTKSSKEHDCFKLIFNTMLIKQLSSSISAEAYALIGQLKRTQVIYQHFVSNL